MNYVQNTIERYPVLAPCAKDMEKATLQLVHAYHGGGKILLCGNGGSAADCEHISGEFLKGFLSKRKIAENEYPLLSKEAKAKLQKGIPCIPLPSLVGVNSAFSNDVDADWIYAQLVLALGKKEDVLICLSTSGNAKNVSLAAETAKALGITTIALTGERESNLSRLCDICIRVPEQETYKIQELHLPVYHALCADVEKTLFE